MTESTTQDLTIDAVFREVLANTDVSVVRRASDETWRSTRFSHARAGLFDVEAKGSTNGSGNVEFRIMEIVEDLPRLRRAGSSTPDAVAATVVGLVEDLIERAEQRWSVPTPVIAGVIAASRSTAQSPGIVARVITPLTIPVNSSTLSGAETVRA